MKRLNLIDILLISIFFYSFEVKALFELPPTLCTNYKKVSSYSEYINEFQKGPCRPIMIYHGAIGALLKVQIDCKIFNEEKPNNDELQEISHKCSYLCKHSNKNYEANLWLTDKGQLEYLFLSDFNIVWKRRECFSLLLKSRKKKVDNTYIEYDLPGIRVAVFGDTLNTKQNSQCGKYAMSYIMGNKPVLYGPFNNNFEQLGYVQGITIQNMSTDFRKNALKNGLIKKTKLALKILNFFTRKKSVLIGHSYGNNSIINSLKSLTQKEKDDLVYHYISIGGPFLGSILDLDFMLGGNNWLYNPSIEKYTGWKWLSKYFDSVNAKYAAKIFPYLDPVYEFIPNFNHIKENVNKYNINKEFIFNQNFRRETLERFQEDLNFVLNDELIIKNYGPFEEKKKYKLNNMNEIMQDFGFTDFVSEYYKSFDYNSLRIDQNPKVPTTIAFVSEVGTMAQLVFYSDPKKSFLNDVFPTYAPISRAGDQTVNLFSLLLSPLNWFVDYKQSKNSDFKQINFWEFGKHEDKKYNDIYEYIHCDDNNIFSISGKSIITSLVDFSKNFIFNIFSSLFNNNIVSNLFEKDNKVNTEFGSLTCNHGGLPLNMGLIKKINNLVTDYKNENVEILEKNDKTIYNKEDSVYEKYILDCPVITCKNDFEECWENFISDFKN